MEKFKVSFYPDAKSTEVVKDSTILSAAISCGIYINAACGGDGVCGRCRVRVKSGKVITHPTASIALEDNNKGIYLACMTTVHSDLEVEILPESRMDLEKLGTQELDLKLQELYSGAENIETQEGSIEEGIFAHSPLATKLYLELDKPGLDDKISDLERLYRGIHKAQDIPIAHTGLSNIRRLGELLRTADWKVTVTLGRNNNTTEIVIVEPADTSSRNYGLSFDIGTTTISGQVIDLNNDKVLGTKAAYNKQAAFGSDIITRIIYAQKQDGLAKLHHAVVETINQIITDLITDNGIDLNDVSCIVIAGNTTMIHLLLRIDPTYIRKEPYIPTANSVPTIRASEAGIQINPHGLLWCVPGVASYVGGDVTAGVLSSGLHNQDRLSILIDVGTNGEIVLGNKEFMIAAAASAGPAFEGSGVSCGMRASRGAIQKVKNISAALAVDYEVIANQKPRGICGSGYIDIIAKMLQAGIIDKSGKINAIKNKRIRDGSQGKEFVIAPAEESALGQDIVITDTDIDNLKRAKAAIYSATAILLKHMGFDFSGVDKFFIAGGFGTYIDINNAVTIGLLPDLGREKFVFIGNSSLSGARKILLSYDAMQKADEISRRITYFELSVEPGYMDEYMGALFFPHTDLNRFPSLRLS